MDMSRDGIHAMLMVFSAASRFTHEDAGTIQSIKMFFGERIVDHMILVFTYGGQVGERVWSRMLTDKDAKYLQVHPPLSRFTLFISVLSNKYMSLPKYMSLCLNQQALICVLV